MSVGYLQEMQPEDPSDCAKPAEKEKNKHISLPTFADPQAHLFVDHLPAPPLGLLAERGRMLSEASRTAVTVRPLLDKNSAWIPSSAAAYELCE